MSTAFHNVKVTFEETLFNDLHLTLVFVILSPSSELFELRKLYRTTLIIVFIRLLNM